jgi:tyramine---L-glutamate ligase
MLTTLVRDLAEAGVDVIASRDPRLPPLPGCELLHPKPGWGPEDLFAGGVDAADAVWPTAPEGGRTLERLVMAVTSAGRALLGCPPAAVRLAASKRDTARVLAASGIPVVPTYGPGEVLPPHPGAWLVKPDDGAGCEGLERLSERAEAERRLTDGADGLVAQPWVEGEPWSLSLLCAKGRAHLLACNRQRVSLRGRQLQLDGIVVNARPPADPRVRNLGPAVAAAMPELWGYVGVDFLLGVEGPVVLEVNPRLTTSYGGLPTALGRNVAALTLDLLRTGVLPNPAPWSGRAVEIAFRPEYAA